MQPIVQLQTLILQQWSDTTMQLSHFKQTNDYIESCASSHLL
jgi:hypothetical protein